MKKFKIGDKVKTRFGVGIIKEIRCCSSQPILVYHFNWNKGHNADSAKGYYGNHCWWFDEYELKLIQDITIDDLQFADVLTLRNGERYVYASGFMYGEDSSYCRDCEELDKEYNNDLTYYYQDETEYDIVKVERDGEVIYERVEEEKVKEMTVEEISKELGYEVKVVRG